MIGKNYLLLAPLVLLLSSMVLAMSLDEYCGPAVISVSTSHTVLFQSYRYPAPYYNGGYTCSYTGRAPTNHRAVVYCDDLDLRISSNCHRTGLIFSPSGDVNFSDGLGPYCGQWSSLTFRSKNRFFRIEFFNYNYNNYFRQRGYNCYIYTERISSPTTTTTTTTTPTTTTTTTTTRPTAPPPPVSDVCGRKNPGNRIVGGEITAVNEFPWMAAMMRTSGAIICGASLISPSYVITAAHCIVPFKGFENIVKISLGDHDLTTSGETNEVQIPVKRMVLHENYNEDTIDNDIGLIELARPVTYNSIIRPVCLPCSIAENQLSGQQGEVTGWGRIAHAGATSDKLRKISVSMLTTSECRKFGTVASKITNNMICAHDIGKDSCQGDSGGPMTYEVGGTNFLVGLVSFGTNCSVTGYPGVYTKVKNYLPWIEEKTGESFCN